MDLGLNIAAAGMLTEQVRQDQLSNDLANASTPGYKPDTVEQQSFGSLLLSNTATGATVGSLTTNVAMGRSVTNLAPGSLQPTGQPLDFGIDGAGFFAVNTPAGPRYTRNGQFHASAAGLLVDSAGNQVLGVARQPIRVSAQGTVPAAQIGVFNLAGAAKQGNNLFTGTPAGGLTGIVRQGVLENSSVNAVTTMVDMIASLRAYEAGQKAIQSIDETMQETASSVGALPG
jgi:flagellar basal-body rod protein FlgG